MAEQKTSSTSGAVKGFFKGLRSALLIYGLFAVVSTAVAGFGFYDFGAAKALIATGEIASTGSLTAYQAITHALESLLPLAAIGTTVSSLFGAISGRNEANEASKHQARGKQRETMRGAEISQAPEQAMPFIMGTGVQAEQAPQTAQTQEHQHSSKWRDQVGGGNRQQQSHTQALLEARAQQQAAETSRA